MAIQDLLTSLGEKFSRQTAAKEIDVDAERLRLATMTADGKEPTSEQLEAAGIVPQHRNRLVCPTNPDHRNTRKIKPVFGSGGGEDAVCDDCGESWKHDAESVNLPAGVMAWNEFTAMVQAVLHRREWKQLAAAVPDAEKTERRIQAERQAAIDTVDAAIRDRDKLFTDTDSELQAAQAAVRAGRQALQRLLSECQEPALLAEQTRLQAELKAAQAECEALRSDLWGQSSPGLLDGIYYDGTGSRGVALLQRIRHIGSLVDAAKEYRPGAFEGPPVVVLMPKIQAGCGSWYGPDSKEFRDCEPSRSERDDKYEKDLESYTKFWESTFAPRIARWLELTERAQQVASDLETLHQRMIQA